MAAASSAGACARRSWALMAGMPQYIMPMPEANHRRNRTQRATPSQRWTKSSPRLTRIEGATRDAVREAMESSMITAHRRHRL